MLLYWDFTVSELNEVALTTKSEQANNEGITNPSLENTFMDTPSPKQESSGNPEDITIEDSSVSEIPGTEYSNAPKMSGTEYSNAPEAPDLAEDGSIPETPSEDETDSSVMDNNPGEETAGADSPGADGPENAELLGVDESPENGEEDMADPSSVNAASSNIAYPQMTGYYLVSITGTVKKPNGIGTLKVIEDCNMSGQRSNLTTTYVTKNRFLPKGRIV